jgi:hypothetical protein
MGLLIAFFHASDQSCADAATLAINDTNAQSFLSRRHPLIRLFMQNQCAAGPGLEAAGNKKTTTPWSLPAPPAFVAYEFFRLLLLVA